MPEVGQAWVTIGGRDAALKGTLARDLQHTRRFTSQAVGMLRPLIGMAGFGGVTYAAVGAVKAAAQFEVQMASVATMLETKTMPLLQGMSRTVLDLSARYGETTASLSKGLYDILSASVRASEATILLETAVRAAKAGMSTTAASADLLTTILNAYGMAAIRGSDVSDKLFATVKRGKTTYDELAQTFGLVAATAAQSNMRLDEALAAVATMTRAGISTSRSVISLNAALMGFLKPSEESAALARTFGFELNAATLASEGLYGVLVKLQRAAPEALADLFPNIRALRAITALRGALSGFATDLDAVADSFGKTAEAFEKTAHTLEHSWRQFKEGWGAWAKRPGTGLISAMFESITPSIPADVRDVMAALRGAEGGGVYGPSRHRGLAGGARPGDVRITPTGEDLEGLLGRGPPPSWLATAWIRREQGGAPSSLAHVYKRLQREWYLREQASIEEARKAKAQADDEALQAQLDYNKARDEGNKRTVEFYSSIAATRNAFYEDEQQENVALHQQRLRAADNELGARLLGIEEEYRQRLLKIDEARQKALEEYPERARLIRDAFIREEMAANKRRVERRIDERLYARQEEEREQAERAAKQRKEEAREEFEFDLETRRLERRWREEDELDAEKARQKARQREAEIGRVLAPGLAFRPRVAQGVERWGGATKDDPVRILRKIEAATKETAKNTRQGGGLAMGA